jgi:hypothetical protein
MTMLRIRLNGLADVRSPAAWVGSPTSKTTTNPNLAATWPERERAEAERVARAVGGTVEAFEWKSVLR